MAEPALTYTASPSAEASTSVARRKRTTPTRALAARPASRAEGTPGGRADPGSQEEMQAPIARSIGVDLGTRYHRQMEDLTRRAAVDVECLHGKKCRAPGSCCDAEVLVTSADRKGVVMQINALRRAVMAAVRRVGSQLVLDVAVQRGPDSPPLR